MTHFFAFLKGFLKNPLQVSSIVPTSSKITQRLAHRIQKGRSVIVEYGPGAGGLTRALLASDRLSADSTIILIEKNDVFVTYLRKVFTDPRVHIFHDSAEHVQRILAACGEREADYIFSSIPFIVMPPSLVERILKETFSALSASGRFIVFLAHVKNRSVLERYFTITEQSFEPANIPPLFIFEAIKKSACREQQADPNNTIVVRTSM